MINNQLVANGISHWLQLQTEAQTLSGESASMPALCLRSGKCEKGPNTPPVGFKFK